MNVVQGLGYLVTIILFVYGVARLRNPSTARSGNALAAAGMVLALGLALVMGSVRHPVVLIAGMAVGAVAGVGGARRVKMTAMPQMVALFNGLGGGAAALVAVADAMHLTAAAHGGTAAGAMALLDILIGVVSFSGSAIAFAKLNEWLTGRPIVFAGHRVLNAIAFLLVLALGGTLAAAGAALHPGLFIVFTGVTVGVGILTVLPIGGGDMPVVISLLNALTGLAVGATGFLLGNAVLIVAGTFVGASGAILTQLMSRAMNRPLTNVIFGAFGAVEAGSVETVEGTVQETTLDDTAILLSYASRVVIVPGYGLAVARAQQEVRELMNRLEEKGVDVKFGIHPVAGRMPGHMNVLLAEVDIPFEKLYDLEGINPQFPQTDVVVVIGANDVTNPHARTNAGSPIYGMPILNVDQARQIIVLKRGMNPGFAGIDNPLFAQPHCKMLFGDARESLASLLRVLDEVVA